MPGYGRGGGYCGLESAFEPLLSDFTYTPLFITALYLPLHGSFKKIVSFEYIYIYNQNNVSNISDLLIKSKNNMKGDTTGFHLEIQRQEYVIRELS